MTARDRKTKTARRGPKAGGTRRPRGGKSESKEVALLRRELNEALQQQTATAEVLRIISNSPGELDAVFSAMLEYAVRICGAKFGSLFRFDGQTFTWVAGFGTPPAMVEFQRRRGPFVPEAGSTFHRMLQTKRINYTVDATKDAEPGVAVRYGGSRSQVAVPMLRNDELVGAIIIFRQEVQPFTDRQVELVHNFAAQAVIAIENARLLGELRRHTDDLGEALERQTATSEVLGVISSSPGELEPVFNAMLENAVRICEAKFGTLQLREGSGFRVAVMHNPPPAYLEARRLNPMIYPTEHNVLGQVIATKQVVHIADYSQEPAYRQGDPSAVSLIELAGARTLVIVPMIKDDELVGNLLLYRQEVQPFTDKQIELVQNFAAQAVIAIENTRLLNELHQRTDDLTKALEQQTATSEVLKVISSSPGNLAPVFEAMVANATRICEANFGIMTLHEDGWFRAVALHNAPPEFAEARRIEPRFRVSDISALSRTVRTKQPQHVVDLRQDESYLAGDIAVRTIVDRAAARSLIDIPMIKDGEVVGVVGIYRQEVRPFTDKQIELLQNFAAQAVIAIENTRLLNELRQRTDDLTESLEQQTATSEVLKVISSSPGELSPVFGAMLENATRICEAKFGFLYRYDGEAFSVAAHLCAAPALLDLIQRGPIHPHPDTVLGCVLATLKPVEVADARLERGYLEGVPVHVAGVEAGSRSLLGVPMMKDGRLVGAFVIFRNEVRPFTAKQTELLQNFAAQAVIAIENTRLLNELRRQTDDLGEALERQTATSEVLNVISNSVNDAQPVFDAIVQSGMRLFPDAAVFVALPENGMIKAAAMAERDPARAAAWRGRFPFPLNREYMHSVAILDRATVDVPDVSNAPPELAVGARNFLASGYRAVTIMPMMRGDTAIGALSVVRLAPGALSDKQLSVLKTFAAQAVIAIENARLLNELRERTDDLSESLQQQTATADVLKVISRSAFDLKTVLNTLLQSAARLCDAEQGTITQRKEDQFFRSVAFGYTPRFLEYVKDQAVEATRNTATGRALVEGKIVHIHDVQNDPEYTWKEAQQLGGFRTMLSIPMLREGEAVGVLTLTRSDVRPFTDKQIELVSTFADQAAIAIENVRLFDEIQDKSRQLAEASQHKSQFLANMSHELRTPLNAILGYTELVVDGVYGKPSDKMESVLKRIEANGRHLLGLINDVLDLSKIEAGQLMLSLDNYSLKDVVQTVFSAVEPLAAEKKLAFKVAVAPDLPSGRADERRLTQVLLNLVGNAIKFTDQGEVLITASSENGSFELSVRDTGPGISPADQTKLFQEFQQADNSTTKAKGGTGLGLAISRRIIEMHGGRIWVESEPGRGATFSLTLPIRVEQQARQQ